MKERGGAAPFTRKPRSDKLKQTTFRFPKEDEKIYDEIDVLVFNHKCSINSLIYLAIRYALNSNDFKNVVLEDNFPRNTSKSFFALLTPEGETKSLTRR